VLSNVDGSSPNYFYYDGDQRRIVSEDSQGRTYFLYDGEKIAVEKNAAGTTQAAYVNQGPSIYEPLIYMDRAGTKSYHLFDHLGSALALASSAQALTDTYRRNAWGVELASTGSTANPFGYVGALGYYDDADLVLLHVGARRYAAARGRFDVRDPRSLAAGGVERSYGGPPRFLKLRSIGTEHRYAYAGNSPAANTDPSGEVWWKPWTWRRKPKGNPCPPFDPLDPCKGIDSASGVTCCGRKHRMCVFYHGDRPNCKTCLENCMTMCMQMQQSKCSPHFAERVFDVCESAFAD